jgi:hypothetical protein
MKAKHSIQLIGFLALAVSARAEIQTTGTPGSPIATTTTDGKQLQLPDPKFGGVIKEKAAGSKPWWATRVVPPKGAPSVLHIMIDDCGFGAPGTFGDVVPTPASDRVAKNGLRYTQFHSTSLCSPTRATSSPEAAREFTLDSKQHKEQCPLTTNRG